MMRTQISLSATEYQRAKQAAKELGLSLAEFFRRALRQALPLKGDKPWMKYCGDITSGDSHSSQHIDDIVYGDKP